MCASEKRTHKIIPFAPANFVVVASAVRREGLRNSRNTPNQGRAGQAYAWRSAGCSDEIRPQSKQRFASFAWARCRRLYLHCRRSKTADLAVLPK